MDRDAKIDLLGAGAQFDVCAGCGGGRTRGDARKWIYPAVRPDGQKVCLLKILMTNTCRNDCRYCALRTSRDVPRTTFDPDELVRLFCDLRRARLVQGLFLSSAVPGRPDVQMERMIAAVRILRNRHRFEGYVHLKVLPGAGRDAVAAAAAVADRVSINLEAPAQLHLDTLTPDKDWREDLHRRMQWLGELVRDPAFRARSHTTQFVIGAGTDSDAAVLSCVDACYRENALHRAYYSAYQPPDDQALPPGAEPDVLRREHRLYQADWLIRNYGFALDEVPFDAAGRLDLTRDPKALWADRHPEFFPVEINQADYATLLRVPGLGPTSAARIVQCRGRSRIRNLSELRALGVVTSRAAPFLLLDGRRAGAGRTQLKLWA